ncbi:Hypothetical lipoprotein [Zobellia galactanivorans]|uniref:Hypothetical lipoprotein n=2 Tax=Zobellia galactanivorans (strain DSM 12802 / CCUG 47099 / CIP 106680 / NCIMB 13871 / Dsij) TaxID=63186 RepID=G0L8D4_ZOBGA|nr:Hypothetical lipoprotein [Zobellia galactanivorans]
MVGNNSKTNKMKKITILPLLLTFLMTACYDEYQTDFESTAAYFANQYPVRTVILDPGSDTFEINVGATYGGKYSYDGASVTLNYTIADTLITNNTEYTDMGIKVMPPSWYTLSDPSTINIVDSNVGFVNVTIKRDSLVKYPAGAQNTYAIPFLLTGGTTDSILDSKKFSIVAVKFKNEFDGRYYVKGKDDELNQDGSVASSIEYNNPALVLNKFIFLTTKERDMLSVPRVGDNESGSDFTYDLKFRPSDGSALLSADPNSEITELVGSAQYDHDNQSFICKYNYRYNDAEHSVIDTLIYANTEIKMESWK